MRSNQPPFRFGISFVLIGSLITTFAGVLPGGTRPALAAPQPAPAASAYGELPLSFIANAGQVDPAVRFQVRSSGGTLSFENSGVMLVLSPSIPGPFPHGMGERESRASISPRPPAGEGPGVRAIRLSFEDANPNASIGSANQLPGIANFFIGNDPAQWHTNVPTYAGVVYHDLYPGVDLSYAGHTGLLKGTYTLAAGVDPSLIRWRYDGATGTKLDANGNLQISALDGVTLTEQAPIAWQTQLGGSQTPVTVGYQVNADGSIQFAPGSYDSALPLTIDPGLVYSTYLGGSGADNGLGIAVDGSGNTYVTGVTSGTFPTTGGALQTTLNGTSDAFVTKLNATGTALVYSTYLGGSGGDVGYGIAVDSSGNAYVTGFTTSTNFPTTGVAVQTTLKGTSDAFVTELNTTGSGLVYSTYLGGSGDEDGLGIAVDGSGNAYVTGNTSSSDFPTTGGALQTTLNGTSDAFVTKLNATGTVLVYSTYLGGSGGDGGRGIAVDSSGNAYVTGDTNGGFPTTGGAFQTSYGGGADVFVGKLNTIGKALVYSTYLSGSADDEGFGIAVDGSGNAYVTGYTESSGFPTTGGAFQTTYGGGGQRSFVSKLNAAGGTLLYSTYLGGSGSDYGQGIAVDSNGNAYITGWTTSGNFSTTSGAYQTTFGGNGDTFVSKANAAGSALVYSTYLGQSGDDRGYGIAIDSNGNAYVTGYTNSSNFPTTTGAYQTIFGGNGNTDAFVSKLDFVPLSTATPTNTPTRTPTPTPTNTPAPPPKDTIGIYRINTSNNNGTFYLRLANSTGNADITVAYGFAGLYPVVGDWNGDGVTTVGVLNQSTGLFQLRDLNTAGAPNYQFTLGNPNDMPIAGRWDNTTIHHGVGVFRPSNGLIYLKDQLVSGFADFQMVLGVPGDVGLGGDWDGNGLDSPGVYRPSNSTFYLSNQVCNCSVFANYTVAYGLGGDTPVVGDWTELGHDGIGLFRPTNGYTYLKNQLTTGFADITFVYGIAGDVPVAGHWQAGAIAPPQPGSVLVPPAVPVPFAPTKPAPTGGIGD